MSHKTTLAPVLAGFAPIALAEMDSVALLNRVDRKYVLPIAKLDSLLRMIAADYRILVIDEHRAFSYNTVYFDTPDFQFYQDHHNGLANRIKVRCREYEETSVRFFEIKRKYRGYRTDKYRRSVPVVMEALDTLALDAIQTKYQKHPVDALAVTLYNRFTRITLVSNQMNERCTIDLDLQFRSPEGVEATVDDLVIIEVKQGKTNVMSPVIQALKALRIYPNSISKYAYGVMLTHPQLKRNAFKALLHRIDKIVQPVATLPTSHTTVH